MQKMPLPAERGLPGNLEALLPRHAPRPGCGTAFGQPRHFFSNGFVYAVISQRARGLSIGVNLSPEQYCNFDCVYCEVARERTGIARKVDLEVMSTELRNLLSTVYEHKLDDLGWFRGLPTELLELKEVALSGDGEPTLCPNFAEVVREVLHVRSQGRFPFFKIVLITNTSGLSLPEVRGGLRLLTSEDEIWVKLDAGTQAGMDKVNRADITLRKVLGNILLIARERPVVVQSLFPLLDGEGPPAEGIEQYVRRLRELAANGAQISIVQIYSAHRPTHQPNCGHAPLKVLSHIAQRVREATGLRAEVF